MGVICKRILRFVINTIRGVLINFLKFFVLSIITRRERRTSFPATWLLRARLPSMFIGRGSREIHRRDPSRITDDQAPFPWKFIR